MKTLKQILEKRGLWDNIHAKRERIKQGSGERMRRPGQKGRPTKKDFERSQVDEAAKIDKSKMPCNKPRAQAVGDSQTGKSHVVKACAGGKEKIIRFGQRGVRGSPRKPGESESYRKRRLRFKARHRKNISKGKMSAAYWANRVKW